MPAKISFDNTPVTRVTKQVIATTPIRGQHTKLVIIDDPEVIDPPMEELSYEPEPEMADEEQELQAIMARLQAKHAAPPPPPPDDDEPEEGDDDWSDDNWDDAQADDDDDDDWDTTFDDDEWEEPGATLLAHVAPDHATIVVDPTQAVPTIPTPVDTFKSFPIRSAPGPDHDLAEAAKEMVNAVNRLLAALANFTQGA